MSLTPSIVWFAIALIIFVITVVIPVVRYIRKKRASKNETL